MRLTSSKRFVSIICYKPNTLLKMKKVNFTVLFSDLLAKSERLSLEME
jgi:hypothetical protein